MSYRYKYLKYKKKYASTYGELTQEAFNHMMKKQKKY